MSALWAALQARAKMTKLAECQNLRLAYVWEYAAHWQATFCSLNGPGRRAERETRALKTSQSREATFSAHLGHPCCLHLCPLTSLSQLEAQCRGAGKPWRALRAQHPADPHKHERDACAAIGQKRAVLTATCNVPHGDLAGSCALNCL